FTRARHHPSGERRIACTTPSTCTRTVSGRGAHTSNTVTAPASHGRVRSSSATRLEPRRRDRGVAASAGHGCRLPRGSNGATKRSATRSLAAPANGGGRGPGDLREWVDGLVRRACGAPVGRFRLRDAGQRPVSGEGVRGAAGAGRGDRVRVGVERAVLSLGGGVGERGRAVGQGVEHGGGAGGRLAGAGGAVG